MRVNLKINTKDFVKNILDGINADLKARVKSIRKPAKEKIAALIERELVASHTVKSLILGQIRHDFGLTVEKAENAVISMISYMSKNIQILSKFNKTSTTITINLLPIDKEFIESIVGGKFTSYKNGIPTGIVDWADWLITKGTQVVITGFHEETDAANSGRSGGNTIMKSGGIFRVEPQHAGTEDDNFITRAIYPKAEAILQIVFDEITR